MVANKKALQYLPAGANINALTYVQLRDWAKAMKDATGEGKLGFRLAPQGVLVALLPASFSPATQVALCARSRMPTPKKPGPISAKCGHT